MAEWREIAGYEGLYLISDEGEVIALPKQVIGRNAYGEIVINKIEKQVKHHLRGKGGLLYPAVTLSKDGKSKAYSVHRLVAEAFIPNPENLPEVNHKDENPLNCKASNLEWCTHQYNIEYSKAKSVAQYYDGELIAKYKSISVASKMTGIGRTSINNVLCGWAKTAGGYEWKYCENTNGRSDDLSL